MADAVKEREEIAQMEMRALASILLERFQFMRQAGITFEGLRDEYTIFGYDRVITAKQYRDEYARGGLAKRIVDCYPKATWRGGVEVYEDEDTEVTTSFEKDWKALNDQHNVFAKLQAVDTLSGLSTFAVLLIGAGGELSTELPKGSPGKVLYLSPFPGGGGPTVSQNTVTQTDSYIDATIKELDTDVRSPRFGLPKFYQLKRVDVSSPQMQKPVHWSRVIHVAEGGLDNEIYGPPWLEAVWNLLIDLRKVTGGGSEAFFLRANQGLQLDVDKELDLSEPEKVALREQAEDYKHNISRMLRTRGVKVNSLGSDVADFSDAVDAIIKQIAGTKGIPLRILTGSEQGELASSQDDANWITQVQDRRTGYAGPMIVRRLIDRLVEYGYLTKPTQYEIGWPVEEDMDELEKADLAVKLANVNKTFGGLVFTDDFIRDKTYDLKPLTQKERDDAEKNKPAPPPMLAGKKPGVPGSSEDNTDQELVAAQQFEMTRVLTAAIAAGNVDVIDRILGIERAPHLPVALHWVEPGADAPLCGDEIKEEFVADQMQKVTCAECLQILKERGLA